MVPSLAVVATGTNRNHGTKHSGTASRNTVPERLEGREFNPALALPQDFLEITQLFSQSAEVDSIKVEFCLGGVVPLFKRASKMKGGNISQLLVTQVLFLFFAQKGQRRAGNRDGDVLAIDAEIAINGVAVPGGDGGKQMNKPDLHRRGECLRTNLKGRNNIAHSVIYPTDRI